MRRGKKRAIVAVGHSILVMAYWMLSRDQPYHELGEDFFDRRNRPKTIQRLARRLENLGCSVTVTATPAAGEPIKFAAVVRIDTPQEVLYYQNGGILQYVLRQMVRSS